MISLANEVYKGLQSAIPFFIHTPPADEISWKGKREGRIRKLKSRSVDEIFRDRWGISGTFPKDAIEIFWGSVLGRTKISRQSLGYHGIFGGWVLKKSCGHFDFFSYTDRGLVDMKWNDTKLHKAATILDKIMEHLDHPSPPFQWCQNGAFLLLRAFIIALGGKGVNCSFLFCPRL